jgi:hypothetical protein
MFLYMMRGTIISKKDQIEAIKEKIQHILYKKIHKIT